MRTEKRYDLRDTLHLAARAYKAGNLDECLALLAPVAAGIGPIRPGAEQEELTRCLRDPSYACRCWIATALPRLRGEIATAQSHPIGVPLALAAAQLVLDADALTNRYMRRIAGGES